MSHISKESIYSFSRTENLPYSTFLSQAGEDIPEILERLTALELENASLKADIASLREAIARQEKEIDCQFKTSIVLSEQIIGLRERAEAKKAAPTEKTLPHLDKLAGHLGEKKKRGVPALMGFREAAQVSGLTKQRISQLRPAIEADGRFTIQSRGKKLYIGLIY